MTFQTQVNQQPAPAVAGDFASTNPRATVLAGPSALVAGANGLTVGRFAWVDPSGTFANNNGPGAPNGFVHNEHTALITQYLGEVSLIIPTGFMVTLFDAGDFWVKNDGTSIAVAGNKAYANNATGQASFAATGTAMTGATSSAAAIAAGATTSTTGSIAVVTNQLGVSQGVFTVTAVGSGVVQIGATLSGTGVTTGTVVTSQLSGATGGVGTYIVSIPQTASSTTITAAYGVLTVGGTVTGAFGVGDAVLGTNVAVPTVITALGTGTGGAGTYIVSPSQTAASAAVTASAAAETAWYCRSYGAPGEVVKISSRAMG